MADTPHTDYVPPMGCDAELPEVSSDNCTPDLQLSEFTDWYFCKETGKDFTDVTDPTEWADRLNDTGTLPADPPEGITVDDLIRHIPVVGSYAAPSVTLKDISGGREQFPVKSTDAVEVTIDDISPENYEFAQFTQSNYPTLKCWFKTKGGMLIGGNKGFIGRTRIDPVFATGSDTLVALTGKINRILKGNSITPDLTTSPI